jgi:hypothetical protein
VKGRSVKADILYDAADGRVVSILRHPPAEPGTSGPTAFLRPGDGQRLATLEIPSEFEHLSLGRLHHAIRIDTQGTDARIVAV